MNMPYDKFIMYINTTPIYETNDDEGDNPGGTGKPTKTGSFNLFDFDQR